MRWYQQYSTIMMQFKKAVISLPVWWLSNSDHRWNRWSDCEIGCLVRKKFHIGNPLEHKSMRGHQFAGHCWKVARWERRNGFKSRLRPWIQHGPRQADFKNKIFQTDCSDCSGVHEKRILSLGILPWAVLFIMMSLSQAQVLWMWCEGVYPIHDARATKGSKRCGTAPLVARTIGWLGDRHPQLPAMLVFKNQSFERFESFWPVLTR